MADEWTDDQAAKQRLDLPGRPLVVESLQHLAQNQIPDHDLICAKQRAQTHDVRSIATVPKSIQTLLSTTIKPFRALCGSAPGHRASGICRTPSLPPAADAA